MLLWPTAKKSKPKRQTVSISGKATMKNLYTKKNPFMSLWLSGANKVAGAARGQATAAVKREATKATKNASTAGAKQVLDFWSGAFAAPTKARAKKRR